MITTPEALYTGQKDWTTDCVSLGAQEGTLSKVHQEAQERSLPVAEDVVAGDEEVQGCVPQELQPLVAGSRLVGPAAMGASLLQQPQIPELVIQQPLQLPAHMNYIISLLVPHTGQRMWYKV